LYFTQPQFCGAADRINVAAVVPLEFEKKLFTRISKFNSVDPVVKFSQFEALTSANAMVNLINHLDQPVEELGF